MLLNRAFASGIRCEPSLRDPGLCALEQIRKNQPLNCDCMLGMYGVAVCEMAVESFRKRRYVKSDESNARRVST